LAPKDYCRGDGIAVPARFERELKQTSQQVVQWIDELADATVEHHDNLAQGPDGQPDLADRQCAQGKLGQGKHSDPELSDGDDPDAELPDGDNSPGDPGPELLILEADMDQRQAPQFRP